MYIPANQVSYKRRVGRLHGRDVFELGVIGGRHLVIAVSNGGYEILGAGSHPAIARHIARSHGVEFDFLAKSEQIDFRCYADLLPRYEAETRMLRAKMGVTKVA